MKTIKFFAAGGTIDKVYFDARSTYQIGDPCIPQLLADIPLNITYSVSSVIRKDSLEMDDSDRQLICETIRNAEEEHIILTHGTDSMVKTAKILSQIKNKTIVITGSLEPAIFKTSDAMFNVGCAVAAVQILPRNVYIAMNGQVFKHDNVVKDLTKNQFVTLVHPESV